MMKIPLPNTIKRNQNPLSIVEVLQILVLVFLILYFGKTLFIPLSFALLISFILYPICKWMENKGISKSIALLISITGVTVLFGIIIYLLYSQVMEFAGEWNAFKLKIVETYSEFGIYLQSQFGINKEEQIVLLKKYIDNPDLQALPFLKSIMLTLTESIFSGIMILVFSILILYYRQLLAHFLYQLFPEKQRNISREILLETIHAYYNFIKGMGLVYLIVGTLNSIGLMIIGVPHPILFGFIASILTFIPYFGIIIASLLPITISWIEFNSIYYPLGVILVFTFVQILEAYVIFPWAVGNRLKINTLVIIVTIAIGGILWGAAGMILFIPFVSIIKLIADRNKALEPLAILLGDGEISNPKK